MSLFGRDPVEADLERIRRANLPPDQLARLEEQERAERQRYAENRPGAKDILAMALAALSVVGPYALIFAALLALFGLIFGRLA